MHFTGRIATIAATTVTASGLALAALATPALAVDPPIAPHAQATAQVNANGTIENSKNVTGVTKVSTGKYCVKLHRDINAARAVPVATLRATADWRSEIYTNVDSSHCAGHPNAIFVYTGKNGAAADEPFFLLVP
ncbi:hypothetical protein [Nonomuraea ceibae]|uniref:hypothetical protein n=1 Tax=Nonomuraea ceibae TaxID=1935170 RepID=UPI001C5F2430|nr:hypothetical protein [Nonomuraea ceibae]